MKPSQADPILNSTEPVQATPQPAPTVSWKPPATEELEARKKQLTAEQLQVRSIVPDATPTFRNHRD